MVFKRKNKQLADKRCENCARRHTMDCPNSKMCYSTTDKPYFIEKDNGQKA